MGKRTILGLVMLVGILWLVLSPFLGGMGSPELVLWFVVLAVVIAAGVVRRRDRRRDLRLASV